MISQFYPPIIGGEESLVRDLSQALARRGHDVAVATTWQPGLEHVGEDGPVAIHRIKTTVGRLAAVHTESDRRHVPPVPDPEAVLGLHRVMRRHRPDVVHGHNWLVRSFLPLKWRTRVPLIVTLHDYSLVCATKRLMYFDSACSGPEFVKCVRCSANTYGRAKGTVVATGQFAAGPALVHATDLYLPVSQTVAERCDLAAGSTPFEVVPNFLPATFTAPDPPHAGLPQLPEEPFILYAGDFARDKGVDVLLDAYSRVRSTMPLVMAGRVVDVDPPDDPSIHVLDPLPRDLMPALWRRCAIAAVPSSWDEPFGLVALEALTTGRPTIVSAAGNLADLVSDGVTGLVVEPGDPAGLASALDRLAGDEHLRDRLGDAAGREGAQYSESLVVPRIEALYAAALERREPAG